MSEIKKKHIVFTGGGSGGHSVVAMTLIEYFRSQGQTEISYIGSSKGIERELCKKYQIPYFSISTGKLRRYFSFQNMLDVFKVAFGVFQSFLLFITTLRQTDIVFSTGGFVSVPAAIAGKIFGKKVFLHEQTTRVGLANRIIAKFADKVYLSFESSQQFFPQGKSIVVGYPLRESFQSSKVHYDSFHGVSLVKPPKKILFVTGGGNGALKLNQWIHENRKKLTEQFIVIHQTGKGFIQDYEAFKTESYIPVAFIGEEFPDLLKAASLVICRAGAGTVSELMALKKRVIFIPLKIAQKNEQFHNAEEALKVLNGKIIDEDQLESTDLLSVIEDMEVDPLKTASPVRESSQEIYHLTLKS